MTINRGPMIQLIDYDMNLVGDVDKFMKNSKLDQVGLNYALITVLGCQSSGKSTLLNKMFGTKFQELDASEGRKQTTKGLWLSADQDSNTLVLDCEGTDSAQRGDDRLTFEHRASLFSLALADVVVINFWYHDLGRYTASNYGLLKTILAVNLELFVQEGDTKKSHLLFVIRDWNSAATKIETIEKNIREDLEKIWADIRKTDRHANSSVDDFFNIIMYGISHKDMDAGKFDLDIQNLKKKYLTQLKPKNYSRNVPSDGFGYYVKSIWDAILHHSELDIPTQKEMLATFRCEEIKSAVIGEMSPLIAKKLSEAQKREISDFSEWASNILKLSMEKYEEQAQRYQQSIFLKKGEQLLNALIAEFQNVYNAHSNHKKNEIVKKSENKLKLEFDASEKECLDKWAKFDVYSREIIDGALAELEDLSSSCCVSVSLTKDLPPESHYFDSTQLTISLSDILKSICDKIRDAQLNEFTKILVRTNSSLDQLEELLIDEKSDGFWLKATILTVEGFEKSLSEFRDAATGLGIEDFDNMCANTTIHATWTKLHEVAKSLDTRLMRIFREEFQNDDEGVPRAWTSLNEKLIKAIYVATKEKVMSQIDVFSKCSFDNSKMNKILRKCNKFFLNI
eukprot:GHVL01042702.1.p1 GENE.GHVL01042702.1~~GHVL01042702.1.p1  ORF type:complete len:624 (+),score=121.59 GHVL01042702.1:843-2714(+)